VRGIDAVIFSAQTACTARREPVMRIAIQYTPETLAMGDKPSFVSATDGDTPTIQTPIRMLGMDAPELHYGGATEANPGKFDAAFAGFLAGKGKALDAGLKAHLADRLDTSASTRHIEAGAAAFAHYQAMVDKRLARVSASTGKPLTPRKLFTMVSSDVFDKYGRMLAYVAPAYTKEEREAIPPAKRPSFNLQMMQDGHATSLIIYPNIPKPADLELVFKAMKDARSKRRGLWKSAKPVLHGFEFRWIVDTLNGKRSGPDRFCGDFTTGKLYLPQHYYKVPPEARMWFMQADAGDAMALGFELQTG
jgi:endonuclease YncB( thermonuclease family)